MGQSRTGIRRRNRPGTKHRPHKEENKTRKKHWSSKKYKHQESRLYHAKPDYRIVYSR
jgi:hypothetical protein